VGTLRSGRDELNFVLMQCPFVLAEKLAGEGRLRLGWSSVRILSLAGRQCFQCLAVDYTWANSRSAEDRSFNYGGLERTQKPLGQVALPDLCVARFEGCPIGQAECSPFNKGMTSHKRDINMVLVVGGATVQLEVNIDSFND